MKILICVLSSIDEVFTPIINTGKKTWNSINVPDVETVYYYGIGNGLRENTEQDYFFNTSGDVPMTRKTIMAFEYFLEHNDFDYIVRPNASLFINKELLKEYLRNKPMGSFYAGKEMNVDGIDFLWGACYILSRDVVKLIVNNKEKIDYIYPDDVAIGIECKRLNIPFRNELVFSEVAIEDSEYIANEFSNELNKYKVNKKLLLTRFLLRCNGGENRKNDIVIMNYIFNLLVEQKSLNEIFDRIGNFDGDVGFNDKGSVHSYIEVYDKLFSSFRNGCRFMEIGIARGHSLSLFDEYFINSELIGVDISVNFMPAKYDNKVEIIECSATSRGFEYYFKDKKFDIIIDDASHSLNDQVIVFEKLKKFMNEGGLYIIEDIQDIDKNKEVFLKLHSNCEIMDLRKIKNRFDDVLVIYRF